MKYLRKTAPVQFLPVFFGDIPLRQIQTKIQHERQRAIKDKWESNRIKNVNLLRKRANDETGKSPHPADVVRKYNYKIRPNTQLVSQISRVLERIPEEHIHSKNSLKSKLQFSFICSIRILARTRDINKTARS